MLDEGGKKHCKDVSTKPRCSIYTPNKLKHDFRQAQCVLKEFEIEEIRKYYRCESELISASGGSSKSDGAFVYNDERKTLYVETITQHYREKHIAAKKLYVDQNKGEYKFFYVRV